MTPSTDQISPAIHERLLSLSSGFNRIRALVVGDVMLDRYWWGSVNRISPEAPVPVVLHQRSTAAAGGAANVAANIAGLSGQPLLVGLVGNDAGGKELRDVLSLAGVATDHLIRLEDRSTTVKTRIVAHGQHVVRVDTEESTSIGLDNSRRVQQHSIDLLSKADVLVISDYAKGMLAPDLLKALIAEAVGIGLPVLVDPKGADYARYEGATLITPNRSEAARAAGVDEHDDDAVQLSGERLLERLNVDACLITLGEEGMMLFRRDESSVHLPAMAREVYDVTGAGDTVIAALSLSIGAGADLLAAATLANVAAGLAVEQVGTTVLSLELLSHELKGMIPAARQEVSGA